jgi:hypothetical protein
MHKIIIILQQQLQVVSTSLAKKTYVNLIFWQFTIIIECSKNSSKNLHVLHNNNSLAALHAYYKKI